MTTAQRAVPLRRTDVVDGRAFAHPDHVVTDAATMLLLIEDLRRHLRDVATSRETLVRFIPAEQNWHRRVILPSPAVLARLSAFSVVGFFGRRRDQVPEEVAQAIDALSKQLVASVPSADGVLGYTTHLLADERNYANLVVFDMPDAIQRWRDSAPHRAAAEVVSPEYYDHVRIYRATVAVGGLEPAEFELNLDCVKYWDFRGHAPWHAVRSLTD